MRKIQKSNNIFYKRHFLRLASNKNKFKFGCAYFREYPANLRRIRHPSFCNVVGDKAQRGQGVQKMALDDVTRGIFGIKFVLVFHCRISFLYALNRASC